MISNIIWKHNAFQWLQIQMFKKTMCFNDFKFKYWKTQCVLMISNSTDRSEVFFFCFCLGNDPEDPYDWAIYVCCALSSCNIMVGYPPSACEWSRKWHHGECPRVWYKNISAISQHLLGLCFFKIRVWLVTFVPMLVVRRRLAASCAFGAEACMTRTEHKYARHDSHQILVGMCLFAHTYILLTLPKVNWLRSPRTLAGVMLC